MKQNLLKVLLLASTVTMSLCACDGKPAESTQPSDVASEEQPNESVTTPSEETPSVSDVVVDEHPPIIELSRYIFLEGEDAQPYVTRFDVWSKALRQYKSYLTKTFVVTMPEECNNGEAEITITSGSTIVNAKIFYYKDVAAAVANTKITIPEDTSSLFDESEFIVNGKVNFTLAEVGGKMLKHTKDVSADKVNGTHIANPTWNTRMVEVWTEALLTANGEVGHYDPSKVTMDHYVVGTGVNDENGNEIMKDNYNCSYFPKWDDPSDAMQPGDVRNYEVIIDKEGRILYLAPISYSSANWARPASEDTYWSCIKDYKENPVFTFADDYDPEENPDAFQKVLPEGGVWIIGYNNQPEKSAGQIDALWQAITGTTSTIYSAESSIKLTMADPKVEESLLNARISYTSGRKIKVYAPANTFEEYAYLYSLALASKDPAKLAMRDEVLNLILTQCLPEVANEEVLLGYYEEATKAKLAEWSALLVE